MQEAKPDAKGIIGALGRFMKGLKDYNVFEMIKVSLGLFFIACIVVFVTKPELVFTKFTEISESVAQKRKDEHAELFSRRMEADENIRGLLTALRESTEADRAWLFEPHNGSANFASGLPFLYVDLTMDICAQDIPPLNTGNYTDIRMSNYPFIAHLLTEGFWYGDVDTLYAHDPKLYHKLAADNTERIAALMLWHGREPLGCIGLSWHRKENVPEWRNVGRKIRECSAQVALELLTTKE